MIRVPGGYAAWSSWCEAFGRGEDLPTAHLVPVFDGSGAELQVRVVRLVGRAYEQRRDRWTEQLRRDLELTDLSRPGALAQVLVTARSRLAPLVRLTRSALLSGELRDELAADLRTAVGRVQDELERMARRDPATEQLALPAVRQCSLIAGLNSDDPAPVNAGDPVARHTGRRVIL